MLMADSDLSSPILPVIPSSVEALDESSSSPIDSIGAHVVQSLALSSPNRDHDDDDQVSLSIPPRNSDGSSLNETLIVSSPISLEQGECNDTRVINNSFQIGSTSQAPDEINDSIWDECLSNRPEKHQSWTPNVSPGYDTDDDSLMEWNQPLLRFKQEPVKIIEPTGVGVGLWNLGNSCFVNSVLQCFTHTMPLLESLRLYKYQDPCNCGNEWFCVIRVLRGHIEAALTTSRYPISPFYFLNNLNYFSPDFHRYQQEDAHEFLQAFLDKLERCCVDRRSDISSQDVNIVQRVFGGRLVSRLSCCNCNSVSETFENSVGLSLEIEDVNNLWNALDSFTSVEKLEDQLTCDNCEEKVSKEKQLLLDKLPLVATFHLKRFKNNGYFMEKIFKHVGFPLELDLQPYMSNSQNNEVATKYHLYAFVEHLGSLAYGHYSSYVRSAPKIWHKFDDQKVTRIDEDSVLSHDSYILFYAREGTPWFSRVFDEMQPLLEASLQNSSPKSVLDPTNGECLSEISYENVDKSNKPCDLAGVSNPHVKTEENCVSLSNESNEDMFLSATESSGEDSPMAELLDPLYDSYAPCTEPSQQKEPDSCLAIEKAITGDEFVPVLMVQNQDTSPKQQEGTFHIQLDHLESAKNQEAACNQPLISDEPNEDVSLSAESSGEDSPMSELSEPLETDNSYDPGAEKEPDACLPIERGTTGDEFVPVFIVQNQDSSLKQQEGTFHVQLEHLETTKNQEEEACKQPLLSDVADPMETEELAHGELTKKQSPRARELYQAIAYTASPTKRIKTKVENENL